jgi:hypothetical protein
VTKVAGENRMVRFVIGFSPATSDTLGLKSGADTRFHRANRQIAVLWPHFNANGVQGVAGSNPEVPISAASRPK